MKNIAISAALLCVGFGALVGIHLSNSQASELEQIAVELRESKKAISALSSEFSSGIDPHNLIQSASTAKSGLQTEINRVITVKTNIFGAANQTRTIRISETNAGPELRAMINQITTLENEVKNSISALVELKDLAAATELRYQKEIDRLYERIDDLKNEGSFGIKELIAGFGLLSGFSTMILAWRSDNRDATKLKIEITKLQFELNKKVSEQNASDNADTPRI